MRRLALVTVSHGSAAELAALLRSAARWVPEAQVVVVDAGGDDGEAAALAGSCGAQVVLRRDNPGYGAANNAGLEVVTADVCALVNPDVELADGALERLAAAARKHDALFAPRLLLPEGRPQPRTVHALPGTAGALLPALVHPPLLPGGLRDRAEPWRAGRARTVGWAITACLVARTATLRALGPFDPSVFLFFEDMDLGLRARAAGVATVFVPEEAVVHVGGHATSRAYGGEPHALLAARRDAVVHAHLGRRAAAADDLAQRTTFATRLAARTLLRRPRDREREQLRAQRALTRSK